MKQIIPFNKEITLKNKIKELTNISLAWQPYGTDPFL